MLNWVNFLFFVPYMNRLLTSVLIHLELIGNVRQNKVLKILV